MSCLANLSQFRLLNDLVGWDVSAAEGIKVAEQLELRPLGDLDHTVDEATLSRWMPPARLAKSCGRCEWFLVTPCPPKSRLLRRDACESCWTEPLPGARCVLQCAAGVAVSPGRIAVSDPGAASIFLFTDRGRRLLNEVPFGRPGPLAYASWREWLVVNEETGRLHRLDMAGVERGLLSPTLPPDTKGRIDRIAVDDQCRIWLAVKQADGRYKLWSAERQDEHFAPATPSDLKEALEPNDLSVVAEEGFCLADGRDYEDDPELCGPCFSWYGRTLDPAPVMVSSPRYTQQGQLLTVAIDSGIPRCRWHRIRLDTVVPSGTTVAVAVASSDDSTPAPQGVATGDWATFEPGLPHPQDWQEGDLNSDDFLIQQPPGRYLFLRLRMTGDGFQTPSVRGIRLDFPRQTSLDLLPFVFREDPDAEDFGERFLSLFDAFLEQTDEVIERLPALLDPGGVPEEILPWLGSFLDIAMDPAWDSDRRRRILRAAPKLFRMRGTVDGMRTAVHLVFDVDPVIQELPLERPWGAVGHLRLSNGVRLFGRSNWRFRLGESQLSQAPIRSFGNPDRDPFNALVHRFEVLVPLVMDSPTRSRLQQLVEAQRPAHTLVTLRGRDRAFILGTNIRAGIDTAFYPFDPTVLQREEPGIRLNRDSVLSAGRALPKPGLKPGRGAVVGVNTALQ